MDPPFKRRRLSGSSFPEVDLHARRAQNDFRLKSIFETIFDKYGRDFDGIGDEIDMETGEIVVDNGHILGMINERDVGDAEEPSEKPRSSDILDEKSSREDSEGLSAALGPSKTRAAAVVEESEASEQSDSDADNVVGDSPAESHLRQLGGKSKRALSVPSDDEEDELASSDIEWASHSKDRLCPQQRWCLKDKLAFSDEPPIDSAIELAWRTPPLPNLAQFKREREIIRLASDDHMQEHSDDERAGISLWAPKTKKGARWRQDSADSTSQQSLPGARGQKNNTDGLLSDPSSSEPTARRKIKWTQEEEELLIHLKTVAKISGTDMKPYFPERRVSAIRSHWKYMVAHGKASPKTQVSTILGCRISLPSLSPAKNSVAPDGSHPSHDQDTFSREKTLQTVQQHVEEGSAEAGNLNRNSSKPTEHPEGHHMSSQYQLGDDQKAPNGYTGDESALISDDFGPHIEYTMRLPVSSARDCEIRDYITVNESLDDASETSAGTSDHRRQVEKGHNRTDQVSIHKDQEGMGRITRSHLPQAYASKIVENAPHMDGGRNIAQSGHRASSIESYADMDPPCSLSMPLEIEGNVVMQRENCASGLPDQRLEIVSEKGDRARAPPSTTLINARPDFEGGKPCSDGTVSSKTRSRCTTAIEASNSPKRLRTSHSTLQREELVHPTAKENVQKNKSTAEGPQKIRSMNLLSNTSAQPLDHDKSNASHQPNAEANNNAKRRQIVQVVVPLVATSNVIRKCGEFEKTLSSQAHIRSPSPSTETEGPDFIGQLVAATECAPSVSGPDMPHQEDFTVRTTTRSPSFTAAESQYGTSAAFVFNDVSPSLGPEIADSQPLNITTVGATPTPELGEEATRPIILDAESPILRSARKLPTKAIKDISNPDSQHLRLNPVVETPARVEEATESDILESGSHPPGKTLSAARSPSNRVRKEIIAGSLSSIWKADDGSEDELSYL